MHQQLRAEKVLHLFSETFSSGGVGGHFSKVKFRKNSNPYLYWAAHGQASKYWCRGHLLGQSFVSSDRGRGPLQDEDHSGSCPRLFPGLCLTRSWMAREWFRSVPVVAGS